MVRIEQLKDLEAAKQVAALLEAENERLHQRLEQLVQENARLKGEDAQARLQLELTGLKEQLALLQQRLFGASSEKRQPPEKAPPPERARDQKGHGPRAQPQLRVQEVLLPLDEADQVCEVIEALGIEVMAPPDVGPRHHVRMALAHGLSAYDALYLDLALAQRCPLATCDVTLGAAARKAGLEVLS